MPFSDYLVFVDESGDHGMVSVDPNYPIFVLGCCLIAKADYVDSITPALQRLKFKYWGHDEQVLHEHEIRKPNKEYSFLFESSARGANARTRRRWWSRGAADARTMRSSSRFDESATA